MDNKLTLKLDRDIIESAKKYAAQKKISLSRLIENYLGAVVSDQKTSDQKINAFVQSLSSSFDIPADYDYKKDHAEFLENKYK